MGNTCCGNSKREQWRERISEHEATHLPPKGIGKVYLPENPKIEAQVINVQTGEVFDSSAGMKRAATSGKGQYKNLQQYILDFHDECFNYHRIARNTEFFIEDF